MCGSRYLTRRRHSKWASTCLLSTRPSWMFSALQKTLLGYKRRAQALDRPIPARLHFDSDAACVFDLTFFKLNCRSPLLTLSSNVFLASNTFLWQWCLQKKTTFIVSLSDQQNVQTWVHFCFPTIDSNWNSWSLHQSDSDSNIAAVAFSFILKITHRINISNGKLDRQMVYNYICKQKVPRAHINQLTDSNIADVAFSFILKITHRTNILNGKFYRKMLYN